MQICFELMEKRIFYMEKLKNKTRNLPNFYHDYCTELYIIYLFIYIFIFNDYISNR